MAASAARVRVLSCDVRSLPGAALASLVRELDPDLACLRRAPKHPGWRGRLAALARRSDLLYAGGGGSSGGTALFTATRVDVRDVREYRLSGGLARSTLGSRGVVTARLAKSGVAFGAASIHLGRDASAPGGQVNGLAHRLGAAAMVFGGGADEPPGGAMWSRLADPLAGRLADAGDAPGRMVPPAPDGGSGIIVAGAVEIEWYDVVPAARGRGSGEHAAVVADLVVGG